MNTRYQVLEQEKNLWISLTGYRTLFLLKLLLEKSRTIDELTDYFKNNRYTNKAVSKDTVRLTINTLKSAGCKISRPSIKNNYHYELISHPFNLNLSEKEIEVFLKLRELFSENLSWQKVLILNKLYEKIASLTGNPDYINKINETMPLSEINKDLLSQLSDFKLAGKKIQISYLSPRNGEENLDVILHKIKYENSKVYLWCYICKYKMNNLLSLERIKNINYISTEKYNIEDNLYEVVYKLSGISMLTFETKDYETVLEKTKDYIIVKANVVNEFWFIQRLLQFCGDFKIISPDFFKEKLINKVKSIRKLYE